MNYKTFLPAVVLFATITIGCAQPTTAPAPNANTPLLLHFDGNLQNSGTANLTMTFGGGAKEAQFAPGKFGQALALDGTYCVSTNADSALYVGDRSWVAQAWIKPDKEQPLHAYILSGGINNGRGWGLRISYQKYLTGFFASGPVNAGVISPDVSSTLFDGKWHHVALIRDSARYGEVRLYLDGKQIKAGKPQFCPPILFDQQKMSCIIGDVLPYQKVTGYKGLIDEVSISTTIPPEYASHEPMSAPPTFTPPMPPFVVNAAASSAPLQLTPENTVIALSPTIFEEGASQGAQLLQKQLLQISGATKGFDIVGSDKFADIAGKAMIALGKTPWVNNADYQPLTGAPPDSFFIHRKNNVITIGSDTSRGVLCGALDFLDKYCGRRFYMPGALWTNTPAQKIITLGAIDMVEKPFVRSVMFTGIGATPDEHEWTLNNVTFRTTGGATQHNMFEVFPPSLYAEKYPDIYPTYDGKRYIPTNAQDQKWQPDFAAPHILEAAEDSAQRYFAQNPAMEYMAIAVQDSHRASEDPVSQATLAAMKKEYPTDDAGTQVDRAQSQLYWSFMNKLGTWMETNLPGKKLLGLAYSVTRFPPAAKLPPNVICFAVLHIGDLEDNGILKTGKDAFTPVDPWLNICTLFGNHDWAMGNGYLIPRSYTGYYSQFLHHLKQRGLDSVYMHIEAYPNWGLDGPKYWIMNRLFWNPDQDPNVLWKQFSDDMFGPASAPMQKYFSDLENLWVMLDNHNGTKRKLFVWNTQFKTSDQSMALVKEARADLDQAAALAATPEQKQRIELFSKTFHVSELLFQFTAAKEISQADLDAAQKYFDDNITNDPMTIYLTMRTPGYFAKILKIVTAGKIKPQ